MTANEVFPSEQLLDHIPLLVDQIAGYLSAPDEEEIAANAAVMDKARELGLLRHQQRASAHQLLHEYEILGRDPRSVPGRGDRTPGPAAVGGRVLRGPAPVDARGARADADDRRHLHRRVHGDDSGTERTDQGVQPRGQPRAAVADRHAAVRRGAARHEAVRQDPERLAKVAATVRRAPIVCRGWSKTCSGMARMRDAVDVPSEQRVELTQLAEEVARQLAEMAAARRVKIRVGAGPPRPGGRSGAHRAGAAQSGGERHQVQRRGKARVRLSRSSPPAGLKTTIEPDRGRHLHDLRARQWPRHPGRRSTGDLRSVLPRPRPLDQELGVTGTGLGLAIVIDCVHALGGSIRCESRAGEGTSFFITLPCGE